MEMEEQDKGLSTAGTTGLVAETHGLTKRYSQSIVAVEDLNLRVRRGEVYGFLGPNGAGKTTTLRMLLGLIRPSSGSARILGKGPGESDGLCRIGSLVESPAFYPYLSGHANLDAAARLSGVQDPGGRVREVLDQVELSHRAKHKFKTYSLGMKQRLGIAAALLKDPELLILDEPTNGLDPKGMAEMRELIRGLGGTAASTGQKRAVLLSSHLMNEVEQVCDRVGIISKGRLVQEGTLADLQGSEGFLLRSEPVEEAARVAGSLPEVEEAEVVGKHEVRLTAEHEAAPEIVEKLVGSGVRIGELRRERRSLEDVFLELTGNGDSSKSSKESGQDVGADAGGSGANTDTGEET